MCSRLKVSSQILLFLLVLAACLGASAQVAAFNTNANFGTVVIGQTSATMTLTATFSSGGTIGSVAALTQGVAGLDFAVTSAGTCKAGQTYSSGTTCTVVSTFAPLFAGVRYGAVVFADNSGKTIASNYLQGIGSGPQAGFQPGPYGAISFPYIGVLPVRAVTVDGGGNVFVGSSINGQVLTTMNEIPSGCADRACVKTLPGSYGAPWGIAVDGAGNIFVADVGASGMISEILASGGYSTVRTLSGSFGTPTSLAVDGNANIFFTTTDANGQVKEMTAASGYSAVTTLATGFQSPSGIAVDGSGNLFVADQNNFHKGVYEILAVGGSIPASPTINALGSGILSAIGVALDAAGNVYVTDSNTNHKGLFEILATGGYTTVKTVFNGFNAPQGLAVDGGGNLYVVDNAQGGQFGASDFLNVVPRAASSGINFPTPTPPGSTDIADGPQTVTLQNLGNSPLTLSSLALSNANFTLNTGASTCTTTTSLAPGATCTVGVTFTPTVSGPYVTGTLTITDNSLNVAGATQPAPLAGAGLITPVVNMTPAPNPVAITQPLTVTVTVNGGTGNPTPTGTVLLNDGPSILTAALTNGSATFNIPAGALATGPDIFSAQYTPDAASSSVYFTSSALASVTVTTTALVTPTVTLNPAFPRTAVSVPLSIAATVSGGTGNPTPTGTVTFFSGNYTSPAIALTGGSANIVVPAGSLAIGTDQFQVTYYPDAASSSQYVGHGLASFVTVTTAPPPVSPSAPGFGSLPIGQTSAASPITLTFGTSATIGTVVAMTQGVPGLDFAVTPGGTCTVGTSFTSGQTCTVNATFTPKFAGERKGGIVVQDGLGKILAEAYVHGTGTGPELILLQEPYIGYGGYLANQNSSSTTIGTGFNHPNVAVDGAGNVFVADWGNNRIEEIPAGCTTPSCVVVVMSGIFAPTDVAVDGAGNLFVAEAGFNDVREIPLGCQSQSCVVTIASGLNQPYGVSVDASGNVFIADTFNGQVKEALAAGGYTTVNTLQTGLDLPWSVVVDSAANLFVAEGGDVCPGTYIPGACLTINTSLIEIPAAGGYTTVNTLASGIFGKPFGLAIDGSGNVYDGDFGNGCPFELFTASGYTSSTRLCSTSGLIDPEGIAVQGNGNLYLPDVLLGSVVKMDLIDTFPINFRTPAQVGQVDTIDGPQYFGVQNNGNAPLTFTAIALSDPSFQFFATGTTCSTSTPLAPGTSCLVAVTFQPLTTGLHNATVTLTDNNLNQVSTTQVFPFSADAIAPAPVILSNPANPTAVTTATFTFSDTQANVTFVCSIDSLPFGACASGIVYPGLPGGPHSFQVKAVDTLGHPSLATVYNWSVINAVTVIAPTITSGPALTTNDGTATFTFSDTQAGVSFLCSLDGAAFTACTSGINYSITIPQTVLNFYHTFAVEAKDGIGNISQPTSYPWLITRDPVLAYPVDFGTVPVGQTSAPQTVTVNFNRLNLVPSVGPIATIVATSLGVTGLDFAVSSPGTCTVGTAITQTSTCTLQVTFSPKLAGRRKGGVILLDAAGNGIADAYLEGIGTAPQITFTPYSTINFNVLPPQNNANPGKNLTTKVTDAAVDGAGNVYVTDLPIISVDGTISQSTGDIWKFAPGCTTAACIVRVPETGSTNNNTSLLLFDVAGLAVDGEGTLWVGDLFGFPGGVPTVYKTPTAFTNACELGHDAGAPIQLQPAIDGLGSVSFIGTGTLSLCQQELGNVGPPIVIFQGVGVGGNASSFDFSNTANSVAVDPQGNIFVADAGNNAIKEVLASSNYTISKIVGSGFKNPVSVASDSFGNIFVSDAGNSVVKEMIASSGYTTILTIAPFNLGTAAYGNYLTVDALGNVYVPNQVTSTTGQLVKLDFSDAPALNFPTPTKIATTDSTDGTLTATVKNSGNAPLTIASLALSGNSFQIDANATTCSATTTLAVGSSCTIGVFFLPTATGSVTSTITLTDNVLNATAATQVLALSGTGYITPVTKTPTVVVTPGTGTITTAQTLSVTVTVSGPAGSPVPTGFISLASGSYTSASVTLSGGTVTITVPAGALANGSDTLTAIYAPDQASSATYNDGAGTASVAVTTTTKVTPAVTVVPTPATVSIEQNLSVTVTVAGTPMPTGTVTLISGTYSSGAVGLSSGSATIVIPARSLPVGSDTLTVNYAPDFASTSNYNNATGSNKVQVQAVVKTAPTVTVAPSPGSITTAQPLTVSVALNGGLGNPAPSGSVVLSSGSYTSGPATLSAGSASFNIPAGTLAVGSDTLAANYTPDNSSASTFTNSAGSGKVTVSTTLTSTTTTLHASAISVSLGSSVTFTATVAPTSGNGTPTGTLTFMDGAAAIGSGPLSSGTATFATSSLAAGGHSVTAVYGGDANNSGSTSAAVSVTVTSVPIAGLAPNPLAFPNTAVGSTATALPITLSNTGTAALNGIAATLTGANPTDFTITSAGTCGATLAASATCTIFVSFTPASASAFTATLSVADSATGSPQTVTLTGTGTAPIAGLSPNPLAFPSTTVGSTATALPVTLSNTGNATLTGISATLTGANPSDFAKTSAGTCGATLAAGSTCTIFVSFTPASAASFSATLSVADNASGSPQTVALTGTGTAVPVPVASIAPNPLAFPSTAVGSTATALSVTLSNTGTATLTGISATLTGTNPSVFTITSAGTCGATLAAGASCTISVSFTPASAASFSATLSVADNASGSPQTVTLTGTGVPVNTDFGVSPITPIQSVQPGAIAQYSITVAALSGFYNNPVTLSASGLPPGATVSFNPASVTPGNTSATSVMSIQIASLTGANSIPGRPQSSGGLAFLVGLCMLPLLGLRRVCRLSRRLPRLMLLLLFGAITLVPILGLTGCGGGFYGPMAQTFTVTVTGTSGTTQHSTTVILTVQ